MDIRTLIAVPVPILCGIGVALAIFWHADRKQAAAGLFALACASLAGGYLLINLRDIAPAFVSIIVANILFSGSFIVIWRGVRRLARLPARPLVELGLLAVLVATLVQFTYVEPDTRVRIIFLTLYAVGIFTLSFFDGLRLESADRAGPLLSLVFISMIVLGFLRAAGTVIQGEVPSFFPTGVFQAAMFLTPALMYVALAYVILSRSPTDSLPGLRPRST